MMSSTDTRDATGQVPTDAGEAQFYLVYLDRSLFDDKVNWMIRGRVTRGMLEATLSRLTSIRDGLEARYRAGAQDD